MCASSSARSGSRRSCMYMLPATHPCAYTRAPRQVRRPSAVDTACGRDSRRRREPFRPASGATQARVAAAGARASGLCTSVSSMSYVSLLSACISLQQPGVRCASVRYGDA